MCNCALMSSKEKSKRNDNKWSSEDVVQAVVIADSFNFRFLPITAEKPRALLPLVNRCLIDYTVEFLAFSGVQEIFVFCCAHSNQVKEHLEKSRWNKKSSPVKIRTIVSEDCPSVGDALRSIDSLALIRSDFVLVSGDLVSNMELKEVIAKHKKLREKDKMTVMTNVYKKAHPGHRTRSVEDDIFVVTNSSTEQVLFCEKLGKKNKTSIPVTIFEENDKVSVNYDVLDCHISVCSPIVPQLFSDNFDYQSRYHFIRGIIVNEEVLGNTIYAHFITDQYAARVGNLQTYEAISKDVIHRWVFPLVPDNSALEEGYSYGRRNIYLGKNMSLALDCVLEEDVVLGTGTSIGAQTFVTHSTVGRNCKIGKGVTIEGCYIWNNVKISDNCVLKQSIISDNVTIQSNVTIEAGSILSYNVVVGKGFTVTAGTRLTTCQKANITCGDDDWDEGDDTGSNSPVANSVPSIECVECEVGVGGKGFKWIPPNPSSDDEELFVTEHWHTLNNIESESGEEDLLEEEGDETGLSQASEPVRALSHERDETVLFYQETLDSIRSGIVDKVPNDNTILMINASKHAYNVPINEVPMNIVKAIMDGSFSSKPEFIGHVLNAIKYYQALLAHYIKGKDIQTNVLSTIMESMLTRDKTFFSVFAKIILELYNLDILEESAILEWYRNVSGHSSDDEHVNLLKQVKPVIDWLNTAEEESDGSD